MNELSPALPRIEQACERLGSTGLYPYAIKDIEQQVFEARQFPKSSGYPEDAATGIAATALSFGLLENGAVLRPSQPLKILQGRAMGRPSEIIVRFDLAAGVPKACWLSGKVGVASTFGASP